MFASANKLLCSPAAKRFKWFLNKDSPKENNDVNSKPWFGGVNTKSAGPKFKMIYRHFDQSQMELGVSLERSQRLSIRILSNKFVINQNRYIMETIFSFVSQPREFSALIFIIRSQGTRITKVADGSHSFDSLQWLYWRGQGEV